MEILTVPAQIENLEEVMSFAGSVAQDARLDVKQIINVCIAVEEVFVNIAKYAYTSGAGEVTISASVDSGKLIIEFADSGTPYNPLAKADPDVTLPADEREIGGLGIFMVKKLMDDVVYRYEDGKNILTIYCR